MESTQENQNDIKKKKRNIFQRFSNRISKYFHKPKSPHLVKNEGCNLSQSCLDDIPVTSKSHDDLSIKDKSKVKRKRLGESLNVPKRNDRCLSEGDLTREGGQFYSQASSPKPGTSGTYESNINDYLTTESNIDNVSKHRNTHSFTNELALKLRGKNPAKDNESEHSKTPESPTGIGTGTSPSRNMFNETRTPRSMSSLSHSSNSLLSGNTTNIYGTSDAESMSRSIIDSHDDIGIVVDLATPICKTTTATLLDSTAARQKIAASKARRVRPKAIVNVACDKTPLNDSGQFSPVRDKRDILEEISEEDCPLTPNMPSNVEEQSMVTESDSRPESEIITRLHSCYPTIVAVEETVLTDEAELNKTEVKIKEELLSQPNESGDSPIDTAHNINSSPPISDEVKPRGFNLHKTHFQFENNKQNSPDKVESIFPVKLRKTGINTSSNNSKHNSDKAEPLRLSDSSKTNHHIAGMPSRDIKSYIVALPTKTECIPTTEANKHADVAQSLTVGTTVDKRASRVLNMVKNFETAPCLESSH